MTKTPPVPAQNPSPYPRDEVPHGASGEGEAIAVAKELAEAKKRWAPSKQQIGLGAAVGIGSAAIVAGLLYWRGGRKDRK
ncbi:hypothetical protein [Sphingomonas hengshuiensis]|uniref:Uncharacterized protein n=1 Tax=Sphingomonas hengshuiensis TaxID=1609977 RepID=A0A7U4LF32_9SPHN|nr:hypothetical protein [Sphingomonas hengshuiensis]AJP71729.1 hypothetical protein TS85_07935 [Sphingomonas hengshuiensis]